MPAKYLPKLPKPEFTSGPESRNFNLSAWKFLIAADSDLTPDEATHLRDALNKYLEYIDNKNWTKVADEG